MKAVQGMDENGAIRLLEDPQVSGTWAVYMLCPDIAPSTMRSIPASAFQVIDGIVALGGHALENVERLWEEELRAPDHP